MRLGSRRGRNWSPGISDRVKPPSSQVHRALSHVIVVGELPPGSLHSVAKLAEELEVSRSPVREALISLADQGMVAFERNRGVLVLQTTAHDLEDAFSLRVLLEVPATFRAAQLMTPERFETPRDALGDVETSARAKTVLAHQEMDSGFHRVILEAAGNARLTGVVETCGPTRRGGGCLRRSATGGHTDIHREHQAILARIGAGEAVGSAAAMRDHLTRSASPVLAEETGDPVELLGAEPPRLNVFSALDGPGTPRSPGARV